MDKESKFTKNNLNKSTHITKKAPANNKNRGESQTNTTSTNIINNGTINNYNISIYPEKSERTEGNPNLNECSIEEINEIIRKNAEARKQYSKTYAEQSYTPLTQNEKVKFLEDFSMNSDKRLKLYSELFKEIKTQINYISNNISGSFVEKDKSLGVLRNRGNFNRSGGNMNDIDEENEVLDFSYDGGNDNLIKKNSSKSNYEKRVSKNKIIKIENPTALNLIAKKESKTIDGDCDVFEADEAVKVEIPCVEYRSNYIRDVDFFSSRRSHSHSASEKNIFRVGNKEDDKKSKKIYQNWNAATINPKEYKYYNSQFRKMSESNDEVIKTLEDQNRDPKNPFFFAKQELQSNSSNINSYNTKRIKESEYNAITSNYSHLNEEDLKFSLATHAGRNNNTLETTSDKSSKCLIF